jgi:hypothetical protein
MRAVTARRGDQFSLGTAQIELQPGLSDQRNFPRLQVLQRVEEIQHRATPLSTFDHENHNDFAAPEQVPGLLSARRDRPWRRKRFLSRRRRSCSQLSWRRPVGPALGGHGLVGRRPGNRVRRSVQLNPLGAAGVKAAISAAFLWQSIASILLNAINALPPSSSRTDPDTTWLVACGMSVSVRKAHTGLPHNPCCPVPLNEGTECSKTRVLQPAWRDPGPLI